MESKPCTWWEDNLRYMRPAKRERTEEMEGGANQREWGERGEVFEWVGREDKSAEELWLIKWTVSE